MIRAVSVSYACSYGACALPKVSISFSRHDSICKQEVLKAGNQQLGCFKIFEGIDLVVDWPVLLVRIYTVLPWHYSGAGHPHDSLAVRSTVRRQLRLSP